MDHFNHFAFWNCAIPNCSTIGSVTVPPITGAAAGQYDGDNEDTVEEGINFEAAIKSKQAARKDKKKTPLNNLYNVSRQHSSL